MKNQCFCSKFSCVNTFILYAVSYKFEEFLQIVDTQKIIQQVADNLIDMP